MNRFLTFIAALLVAGLLVSYHIRTHPLYVYEFTEKLIDMRQAFLLPFRLAELRDEPIDTELYMPVEGVLVREVADTWGASRSGGREHNGQDIFAERGTPIYSATNGYVTRIGESNIGGNIIFISSAGGRRYYYAHLDEFAFALEYGDEVTTETLLGTVGNTGNAATTPPHLHFSVYGAGGAIDPLPLLVDRE